MARFRTKSLRRVATSWLVGLVTVATFLSLAVPASANSPVGRDLATVKQPMVVTGFDREVAEANGFSIVMMDGVKTLVHVTRQGIQEPLNQIGGSCGYSYAYLTDIGPNQYRVRTGFHTNQASISYAWFVDVTSNDPVYSRFFQKIGTLALRNDWDWRPTGTTPDDGYFRVKVSVASWSELWTGAVCNSLGPSEVQYIN